jgi:anti-anti-sigma regulatory factor
MEIRAERVDGSDLAVFTLEGELDASNFEALIDAARTAAGNGVRRLVLDLGGLTYMGSSGLVALHSAAMLMRGEEPPSPESGWSAFHQLGDEISAPPDREPLALAAPQPPVRRVLERSGMARIFPIHPDREAAVGALRDVGG